MDKTNERENLDVLLNCLARLDNFKSNSITDSDKPDFIITCGDKKIGVETTWSVDQEVVRAGKLHFSQCPNLWIDGTRLKDRESRRTNMEIIVDITNQAGPWKKVEDDWLDWKNKIAARLKSKRKKYNQSGFQIFDENWLLITDFPPLPKIPLIQKRALRALTIVFSEALECPRDFDTVFFRSGQYLFRWHKKELQLSDIAIVSQLTLAENSPPLCK